MHVKKYALFQVACRLLSSYSMRSVVFVRVTKTTTHQSYKREPGLSELGGWGPEGPWPPRFGRSLNPISTGGQIVPTKLILAPPSSPRIFRPSYGPSSYRPLRLEATPNSSSTNLLFRQFS